MNDHRARLLLVTLEAAVTVPPEAAIRLIGIAVVLAASLVLAPRSAEVQHATTGLAFHQAFSASVGLADPARFERLERPTEEGDVYVERTAALVIRPDEITTVVITREPVYADTASDDGSVSPPVRPAGATATPTDHELLLHGHHPCRHSRGRRLHAFTTKNVGQRVDVRFNGTRLAVAKILEPLSSGQLSTSLSEWIRAQIEQVFAVLKQKLIWKADEP